MYALFDNIQKSKEHELKFQAGIHGVELKDSNNHADRVDNLERPVPFFGDPDEYKHLSVEEREQLTQKMMGKHKTWAKGGVLK